MFSLVLSFAPKERTSLELCSLATERTQEPSLFLSSKKEYRPQTAMVPFQNHSCYPFISLFQVHSHHSLKIIIPSRFHRCPKYHHNPSAFSAAQIDNNKIAIRLQLSVSSVPSVFVFVMVIVATYSSSYTTPRTCGVLREGLS